VKTDETSATCNQDSRHGFSINLQIIESLTLDRSDEVSPNHTCLLDFSVGQGTGKNSPAKSLSVSQWRPLHERRHENPF
jgi:hypothetical protein